MSKIKNAFKDGKAFIGFLTAGDPSIEKSCEYILTMERAGADLVEIGIPFSDPIAEGVVIQEANIQSAFLFPIPSPKASSSRKPTSGPCRLTRGWKTCSASSKWYGSSLRFRWYF